MVSEPGNLIFEEFCQNVDFQRFCKTLENEAPRLRDNHSETRLEKLTPWIKCAAPEAASKVDSWKTEKMPGVATALPVLPYPAGSAAPPGQRAVTSPLGDPGDPVWYDVPPT